ncbi:hypothetical protein G9P44_005838 [Scheffersomyces stipitis]|nr:hypothetical protein G9P44_005838 [Scheffersomyces stipitis]
MFLDEDGTILELAHSTFDGNGTSYTELSIEYDQLSQLNFFGIGKYDDDVDYCSRWYDILKWKEKKRQERSSDLTKRSCNSVECHMSNKRAT